MHGMKAIQMAERPPMYYEARKYAEQHGITDVESLEQARLAMCHRAFMDEMEPWWQKLAKLRAMEPVIGQPSASYTEAESAVHEIAKWAAARYGLDPGENS